MTVQKLRRALNTPRRRRWTLEEYYRIAEMGLFRDQRVELVDGEILQMPPQKNFHVIGIDLVRQALQAAFGPGHWVRIQAPLHLQPNSAPEPDLAVVPGSSRDYAAKDHPTSALLIVEVSDTTLIYDRGRKASLYARAGVADYWILNLVDNRLEVRRRPVADPSLKTGYRYADVSVLTMAEQATPLAAPQSKIAVGDLLP
jgi:Uma2 family endonuclease